MLFLFLCQSRLRIANLSVCLRTSVEHVGCDVKSRCVRSFTLSNPLALVFDLTRDEVVDELRTWHGSLATAGEFTTESQCCFLNLNHNVAFFEPQLRSQVDLAKVLRNCLGQPRPRISADEKDVCRSDRLGKPPVFSDKEEEIPRMCQECCELHVRCVSERARSSVVCGDSQDVVSNSGCARCA